MKDCKDCICFDPDKEVCDLPEKFRKDHCPLQIDVYEETGTDLQLGKYDEEVMNGRGYYDSSGRFVRNGVGD